mmetsp:Transcript_19514/g.66932  ORF Transcript_19514/g.66932 Transcript_19514/m.66932 type:complete len:136 (+) Transcript_19514:1714-2121(+)
MAPSTPRYDAALARPESFSSDCGPNKKGGRRFQNKADGAFPGPSPRLFAFELGSSHLRRLFRRRFRDPRPSLFGPRRALARMPTPLLEETAPGDRCGTSANKAGATENPNGRLAQSLEAHLNSFSTRPKSFKRRF